MLPEGKVSRLHESPMASVDKPSPRRLALEGGGHRLSARRFDRAGRSLPRVHRPDRDVRIGRRASTCAESALALNARSASARQLPADSCLPAGAAVSLCGVSLWRLVSVPFACSAHVRESFFSARHGPGRSDHVAGAVRRPLQT